jgi:multidrug efflux pump subunit AcrB
LPLGVVGGLISQFFLPFALTVTYALLASLVIALTVIPVLAYFLVKVKGAKATIASSTEETVYMVDYESDGMTMIAGVPTRAAAAATPWAWLPDANATTPRAFSSALSRLMRF